MLVQDSGLDVVLSFDVRQLGVRARVGQLAVLRDRFPVDRTQIGERIVARVVVVLIVPDVSTNRQRGRSAEDPRPRWGDVKRADLRALVRVTKTRAGGPDDVEIVEGIWRLKPGARVLKIQVQVVLRSDLKVQAIEN